MSRVHASCTRYISVIHFGANLCHHQAAIRHTVSDLDEAMRGGEVVQEGKKGGGEEEEDINKKS